MKFVLGFAWFCWLGSVNQSWSQNLSELLLEYLNDPYIAQAQNSILAIDIHSGDTLLNFQSNLALTTASTTKVFSTAMALELLGADYRFSTECYMDGNVKDSVLKGNVWIRGLGDVTFGSRFFNAEGEEGSLLQGMVSELKKQGIRQIDGSIFIDGSAFGYEGTPKGWSAWDAGNYYGAFPAGINYYDNAVNYYFSTGKPGRKAQFMGTYPQQSQLELQNQILSAKVRGDNSNLQGEAYRQTRLATGKLPAYQSSYKVRGSVADPELNFADALSDACASGGLALKKGVFCMRTAGISIPDYDGLIRILKLEGRTVGEIVQWTNGKSVNFFAEGLLNGAAYKYTGCGTNSNGLKLYKQYLATRMDTTNLRLFDGSGLSRDNRISAAHLCGILTYVFKSDIGQVFKASLPVAGKSGTIKDLCVGQAGENRVYAKSGTMTGIKSYAGYIFTVSGRTIVFSIISSGYTCSQSHVKSKMQVLLNALSAL